ncbi:MAG: TonB-dependent receptor [Flavobacteriales bacterium]|nr:TonB-dependent receptor [Flavobacteriales bacterium]
MRYIYLLIGFYFSSFLLSQKLEKDTLVLKEVIIQSEDLKNYSTGHQIVNLKNDSLNTYLRLNNVLEDQLGINFKNYGLGMLSSITTKGLSASHTGFYWEGIPVNSSLNGQTDINLFPIEQSENIEFRSGGGSSVFGSGAIGGSIHLSNPIKFGKKQLEINQGMGSFSTFKSNTKGTFSTEKIYFDASIYNLTSTNDYEYKTLKGKIEEVENTRIQQNQFSIHSAYKFNKTNLIKFDFQRMWSERELPSSMNSSRSYSKQNDKSNRSSLKYSTQLSNLKLDAQLAYNDEKYAYIDDVRNRKKSILKAKNYFAGLTLNKSFSESLQFQFKNLTQLTKANGESFGEQEITQNFSTLSAFYKFNSNLKSSINLNKSFSSQYTIPFTFDAGINYRIKKNHSLNANFTTNYRVPTINDLYWNPGGNRNLKSEKGWIGELGYELNKEINVLDNSVLTTRFFAQFHYGKISDWILWQPMNSGFWSPVNIQEVEIRGLETHVNFQLKIQTISLHYKNIYKYTESVNQKNNYQLSYIPLHTMNQSFGISFKNLSVNYGVNFVGKRYTVSDESDELNAYFLHNFFVNYGFKIDGKQFYVSATVNNITNAEYYGIKNYPLPLRNYFLNLNITL